MKLWAARRRVEPEAVEPLLFRAALNLASNRLRARRLWRMVTLEPLRERASPAPTAESQLSSEQTRAAVRAAIEALPPKLKDTLILCELSGMSHKQISEPLGIPVGTVGSRRNLAMAALESRLGTLEDA